MGKRVDFKTSDNWNPGEDATHRITVTNKANTAVALTGMTLKYSIRRTRKGATLSPFTDKTTSSGIALASSSGNTDDIAVVTINAADTTGMDGKVWFILERTDSGDKIVIAEGTIPFEDVGL